MTGRDRFGSIAGRTVLYTGAAGGLGRETTHISWQAAASAYLREGLDRGHSGRLVARWLNRTHAENIGEKER